MDISKKALTLAIIAMLSSSVYAVPVPIYNGIIGTDVTPTPAYASGADNDITTAIQAMINNNGLTVTTNNGVVTLAGTVASSGILESTINQIISIPNVKDIDVSQVVIPANNDMVITARIKLAYSQAKIFGNTPIPAFPIRIQTINNRVDLSGTVDEEKTAAIAKNIAASVQGVTQVTSNIKVNHPAETAIVTKETTTTTVSRPPTGSPPMLMGPNGPYPATQQQEQYPQYPRPTVPVGY